MSTYPLPKETMAAIARMHSHGIHVPEAWDKWEGLALMIGDSYIEDEPGEERYERWLETYKDVCPYYLYVLAMDPFAMQTVSAAVKNDWMEGRC